MTDANLRVLGLGTCRNRVSFAHALTQVFAYGHTMALNRLGADLARYASEMVSAISIHDWWLYQTLTGAGGKIINDPVPLVLYRQHGDNALGANLGMRGRARWVRFIVGGGYRRWVELNIQALRKVRPLLTPANAALFDQFQQARTTRGIRQTARLNTQGIQPVGLLPKTLFSGAILTGLA